MRKDGERGTVCLCLCVGVGGFFQDCQEERMVCFLIQYSRDPSLSRMSIRLENKVIVTIDSVCILYGYAIACKLNIKKPHIIWFFLKDSYLLSQSFFPRLFKNCCKTCPIVRQL